LDGNKWGLYADGSLLLDEEMRNFDEMVEYYRNHPEEAKNILKHAGKLEEDKWVDKRQKNPDEIVLEDVKLFHLENMSQSHIWVGCYTEDNRIFHLNISAKGNKLTYYWSEETPE
jgi:hypothetical protein